MADGNTQPGDPSPPPARPSPLRPISISKFDLNFDIIQLDPRSERRGLRSGMEPQLQDTYYYNEYRNHFAGTGI